MKKEEGTAPAVLSDRVDDKITPPHLFIKEKPFIHQNVIAVIEAEAGKMPAKKIICFFLSQQERLAIIKLR